MAAGLEFDVVVVGGGPAGCAVAHRVAVARPSWRVALLEAEKPKPGVLARTPTGFVGTVGRKSGMNYAFETVPQPGLNGRCGFQPRGRGLGGSSLINAMIYIRGQHEDYDHWAAQGCPGWAWADVAPHFKRAERNSRGASIWHGNNGPLHVSDVNNSSAATKAFIEVARQLQYRMNPDFNGNSQEGIEPPRDCRRPFGLSYAAMGASSSMA